MTKEKIIENITKEINQAKNIAIFSHKHIDGDGIGSMLGLGGILEKQNKNISYFTPEKPGKIFDFLDGVKKIKKKFDYGKYDLLIFVDFSNYSRINKYYENNENYFKKQKTIKIDHHTGEKKSKLSFIDSNSLSACKLIYDIIETKYNKLIDKKIATYLYLGLITDSGSFKYGNNQQTIDLLKTATKLLKKGAEKNIINHNLFNNYSYNYIKYLNQFIKKIKIYNNIIYSTIDEKELSKYNIDLEQAKQSLNIILRKIGGYDLYVLIYRQNDNIFCSLRHPGVYNGDIYCNKIAEEFGGGGHLFAAGFNIKKEGNFKDQTKKIIKKINLLLNNNKG